MYINYVGCIYIFQIVSVKGPESNTCLDVPNGRQYNARIRTKPTGAFYSGHWSDWSEVLSGDTPTEGGKVAQSKALPLNKCRHLVLSCETTPSSS